MSPTIKNSLWNSAFGIRFSSKVGHQPSYPFLDISRFVHTPASSSEATLNPEVEFDEFNEGEEFERDAAEWFDQQDRLVLPVTETISEGTQVASDTDGNLVDASKQEAAPAEAVAAPLTSLDYTIDTDLWDAARRSKAGSHDSFWSYRMYRRILENGEQQKVKVHYCTSRHTMEYVCRHYFAGEKVIGFDLEWLVGRGGSNVNPRRNVSLIQIASPSRIGLFHIALFAGNDYIAPTFKKIMEDESVTKVGVAIKGDCTRVKNNLGIDSKGILELSHLYKLVKYSKTGELNRINKVMVSLAAQTQEMLGLPLFKGDDVRSSNWMMRLSQDQVAYSASDAYVCLQLYYVLEQERMKLQPTPPRPAFVERNIPIQFLTADDVDESDETLESGESEVISDVEAELDASEFKPAQPTIIPTTKTIPPSEKQARDTRDARITVAEDKAHQYRTKASQKLGIPLSSLRTYFIWYDNHDLTPEAIAAILRAPPLKTNTVVSYILDVIVTEKLPFDKTRLRTEVLVHLAPQSLSSARYQVLAEASQESEEEL
ncbi:Werner syndrome ATP-dependent helicase like protein [Fusarium austroafricanum]|uniref:Werner syndrome ATP-dependent helicase like protein n=1 Tax=Fusarium austroafricanum TaxID=2364996 RepID=A0A8H4P4V9_9HYPO|nr:Werner syndrome ATP-dependent helicase like protein [Fusarium austroafricanum]